MILEWLETCILTSSILKFQVMKKAFFRVLNNINKAILPKYSKRDFTKLNKFQKLIFGYRYKVLVNSLD
ncbi:hypothetical protein SAMN04488097_0577 [Epilithonimonas lactis]|nr:hypothetical protein SAMN04488097_0577 [Epilithonimonas lactis]